MRDELPIALLAKEHNMLFKIHQTLVYSVYSQKHLFEADQRHRFGGSLQAIPGPPSRPLSRAGIGCLECLHLRAAPGRLARDKVTC